MPGNTNRINLITIKFNNMKNLVSKSHFAIYILLTCVFAGCVGNYSNNEKQITFDSLRVEFNKAHELCNYYQAMQDSSGGVINDFDVWWAYRDSSNRAIDKMITITDEMIEVVKNAP